MAHDANPPVSEGDTEAMPRHSPHISTLSESSPAPGPSNEMEDLVPTPPTRDERPLFWIELPPPPLDRENYIRIDESVRTRRRSGTQSPASEDDEEEDEGEEPQLQEIVGEFTFENGKTYLYARLRSEVCRKFSREYLTKYFGELVQEYDELKATKQLEEFDPSSTEVHPKDRAPRAKSFKPKAGSSATTRSKLRTRAPSSQRFSSDAESPDSSDDEGDEDRSISPIRITRSGVDGRARVRRKHSPRKTRAMGSASSVSSAYDISDEDELSSDGPITIKIKIPRKVAPPNPEYGSVRDVKYFEHGQADLDDSPALHAHHKICDKCHTAPTHILLARFARRKGKKKRKPADSDLEMEEEEELEKKGGWATCLTCPTALHWGCLPAARRVEIIRSIRQKEADGHESQEGEKKRRTLKPDEMTDFVCVHCARGGICLGCHEPVAALKEELKLASPPADASGSVPPDTAAERPPSAPPPPKTEAQQALLFRCRTCKRPAHYHHLSRLSVPDEDDMDADLSPNDIAEEYQENGWECKDCKSWMHTLDRILSWRPYPSDAIETPPEDGRPPNIKDPLPREYLVKWVDRSFRRLEWVPHQFLLARSAAKLKNFIKGGTKVALLPLDHRHVVAKVAAAKSGVKGDSPTSPSASPPRTLDLDLDGPAPVPDDDEDDEETTPRADPLAEFRVPDAWRSVDRILEVRFWKSAVSKSRSKKSKGKGKSTRRVESDGEYAPSDPDEEDKEDEDTVAKLALPEGVEPEEHLTESYARRLRRMGSVTVADADDVVWALMKWGELGYDEVTWDTPPRDTLGVTSFKKAFSRYLDARTIIVPTLTAKEALKRDERPQKIFDSIQQPDWGQTGKLKPFQLDGLTWLYENWHNHQQCILADEMGLGKTVQIVTFIGMLIEKKVFPCLVVVPNSTITNWVREFEFWAPHVRVVMYAGEAKARETIERYEMYNDRGVSFHVLVTTYESVSNPKDFNRVFKSVARWETLIVDEGQRLKSEGSLLFQKLKELNSIHRILMTGTPLNNNIRELFTLMNFLDPSKWNNLNEMTQHYEHLTDELVAELHGKLKPYFLRRVKVDVMQDLPPKREVIVPLSMAKFQKEVYRSILSQNTQLLGMLASSATGGTLAKSKPVFKANMNNALMQLRKCMQHPYLVDQNLQPKDLGKREEHKQLVDSSAKMKLLQVMLPKLKEKGHRVLLFSQFKIALDLIEEFLEGEGYNYIRLDGDTKQSQRQKDMDEFNRPGSDIFIYILSTRAGGVGINLWSADTVIIHDMDFNPHQDLQAIARAHRMGQKKPVLVFTLMIKDAAEEKIVQAGKKKLALDHLIVQNMDERDEAGESVRSILSFGAKALFEEGAASTDIHYSSDDVDKLIERIETQKDEPAAAGEGGMKFEFAKIWERQKDALEDVPADAVEEDTGGDFWAQVLERTRLEEAEKAAREQTGRGVRRNATKAVYVVDKGDMDIDSPPRASKSKSANSSDNDWGEMHISSPPSTDDEDDHIHVYPDPFAPVHLSANGNLAPYQKYPVEEEGAPCKLCLKSHPPGKCTADTVEHLRAYRKMILDPGNTEHPDVKRAALKVVERRLAKAGVAEPPRAKKTKHVDPKPEQKRTAPVDGPSGPDVPVKKKPKQKSGGASTAEVTGPPYTPADLDMLFGSTSHASGSKSIPVKTTVASTHAHKPKAPRPLPLDDTDDPPPQSTKPKPKPRRHPTSEPEISPPPNMSAFDRFKFDTNGTLPPKPKGKGKASTNLKVEKPAVDPSASSSKMQRPKATAFSKEILAEKKKEAADQPTCPICLSAPTHHFTDCHIVQDPMRLRLAMGRLRTFGACDEALIKEILEYQEKYHTPVIKRGSGSTAKRPSGSSKAAPPETIIISDSD